MMTDSLHDEGPVATAGRPLAEARAALILLHGRGATAESILSLADYLPRANMAYLAPQAANLRLERLIPIDILIIGPSGHK